MCPVSQGQRIEVVRLLLNLASSTATVRDQLEDDEVRRRDLRRELHEIRVKMKRCAARRMHTEPKAKF